MDPEIIETSGGTSTSPSDNPPTSVMKHEKEQGLLSCSSLVVSSIEMNQEIDITDQSVEHISMEHLLHNMHRTFTKDEMQEFTEMVGKEDGEGLFDICKLCYHSLQDNATQIKGQRIMQRETEIFKSDYGEITFSMIEKSQVFKIIQDVSGEVIISGNNLRIHEFLAASIAILQNKKDLTQAIQKMDFERASAVLTDMVNLMTGEDPVQTNFLIFLQKMGNTTFEKEQVVQLAYEQICIMSKDALPEFDSEEKILDFTVYKGGKRFLGKNIGGKKLRIPQTVLLAKLVSVSGIPAPITIDKKANKWDLTFKNPGAEGFPASEVKNLLAFIKIQKASPDTVKIEYECAHGTTAVMWKYIQQNPDAKTTFKDGCCFFLDSQDDINGLINLINKHHISPDKIDSLYCAATCNLPSIPLLVPLMIQVKRIGVEAEQKYEFWERISQEIITEEGKSCYLHLANVKITEENRKMIVQCMTKMKSVNIVSIEMQKSDFSYLSSELNKENNKISRLSFMKIKIRLEDVEEIIACLGSVEEVMLDTAEITEEIWQKIEDGLVEMANKGILKLKLLEISESLAKPENIYAKKMKAIGITFSIIFTDD